MDRDFGEEIFAGAADYYAKYRPRYPRQLFDDLVHEFGLDGRGRLLDLGCGTGELAIPLAKYFEHVLAADPDADMLAAGQAKAQKLKIGNIGWQKASSKELNHLKGPLWLVSMGQSFHWMDQEKVLDYLYDLIDRGGGLAIVGTDSAQQRSVVSDEYGVVKELVREYLGPERRAGTKIYTPPPKRYEDLLPASKFRDFRERYYDVELARDLDQIVGQVFSMSWALRSHFGERAGEFEAELKRRLKPALRDGKVHDKYRFVLYTMHK